MKTKNTESIAEIFQVTSNTTLYVVRHDNCKHEFVIFEDDLKEIEGEIDCPICSGSTIKIRLDEKRYFLFIPLKNKI